MRTLVVTLLVVAACSGGDDAADAQPPADAPPGGGADGTPPTSDATPPVTYPCEPTPTPGHQKVTCPDGVEVDVEASTDCVAGGCGLILDLHGLTTTAQIEENLTRMRLLAPPRGYVVLQPTSPGTLHEWSSGTWDDSVWSFVRAARDRFAIDPDRVHVMGFSQGGMMTLRLLCTHSDEIASVAPAAGGGCFSGGGGPAVARPILYTHGTRDDIVAFSVGTQVRDGAIARYGLGSGEVFRSGSAYTATRWAGSDGAIQLEFWQHDFTWPAFGGLSDSGHCLPGPVTNDDFRCRDDGQFDHSLEILRFFDEHPR